jgi:hypothetical protein
VNICSHITFRRMMLLLSTSTLLLLPSCSSTSAQLTSTTTTLSPVDARDLRIVTGQTVFVPAYSELFSGNGDRLRGLNITLAIHNSDPDDTIIIRSVRYYDTDGNLIREYVSSPVQLKPMATTGFRIAEGESSAGWGSNFLIEWGAEKPVFEPVIEAVMVSGAGADGISFISAGRVVSQQ